MDIDFLIRQLNGACKIKNTVKEKNFFAKLKDITQLRRLCSTQYFYLLYVYNIVGADLRVVFLGCNKKCPFLTINCNNLLPHLDFLEKNRIQLLTFPSMFL